MTKTQLTIARRGNTFVAADEETLTAMRKVPDGVMFTREWRMVRNPKHHRLRFAWVRDLFAFIEHAGLFKSPEELRAHITIAAGALVQHVNPFTGEITQVPKSWAYNAMDEAEFSEMVQRAQAYLIGDFADLVAPRCNWTDSDLIGWESVVCP